MTAIPALTVWQPWTSLIMIGAKPYEFRGWRPPRAYHGRRIAIHAGARKVQRSEVRALLVRLASPNAWTTALIRDLAVPLLERAYREPECLPLASVLGTAILGPPKIGSAIRDEFNGPVALNDSDRDEHCNWAWPLTDIERLEPPVPARGAQGFWPWEGVTA